MKTGYFPKGDAVWYRFPSGSEQALAQLHPSEDAEWWAEALNQRAARERGIAPESLPPSAEE